MKSAFFALISVVMFGCTVAPHIALPAGPSLDNGLPNSGVLAALPGNAYLVTSLWNERYAALIRLHGAEYIPPLNAPRWITSTNGGNYVVTSDGMAAFAYLNILSKQH